MFVTAETIRTLTDYSKIPDVPFWNGPRSQSLLDLLGELNPDGTSNVPITRVRVEWNRVVNASPAYEIKGPIIPFHIRSTYNDPDGQAEDLAIIDGDANAAADLAMRWHFLGDEDAAAKATAIISAWSAVDSWDVTGGATTALVWSSRIPKLIEAAYMLRSYAPFGLVEPAFKACIVASIAAEASASVAWSNNVGVWGTVFDIATGKYLEDQAALDAGIAKWRKLFDDSIVDNVPIEEVYRQANAQGDGSYGLWYSNFTVYAFVIAAEWARYAGVWLYDYVGKDGSSLKGLTLLVRYWTRYPRLFPYNTSGIPSSTVRSLPHDEITHALWPNADSEWILANYPGGSDRDSHGVRGSVLIYRTRPLYG